MSGLADYSASAKNQWRDQLWHTVADRYTGGIVLYLPGPHDKDRSLATLGDILDHNQDMIAVEMDRSRARALRRRGINVINDRITHVLTEWPEHTPIGAVVADFCNGLTDDKMDFLGSLLYCEALSGDSVVGVNLLRGRDAGHFLEWAKNGGPSLRADSGAVHRGHGFGAAYAYLSVSCSTATRSTRRHHTNTMGRTLVKHMNPQTSSYRSGVQVFDSVVFNCAPWPTAPESVTTPVSSKPKVSAALAVRTTRKGA